MKTTWKRWAALTSLVTGCVPNCPRGGVEVIVYDEDFERRCETSPCGWSVVTAPPGGSELWSFETVSTIHPGETGVRLVGDGLGVSSDGAGNRGPNGSLSFPLVVRTSARCDAGTSLVVRVVTERPDSRERVSYTTTLEPPETWSTPTTATLERDDRRGESFESLGRRVLETSLELRGVGACEVDRLLVADMSFSGGYCD